MTTEEQAEYERLTKESLLQSKVYRDMLDRIMGLTGDAQHTNENCVLGVVRVVRERDEALRELSLIDSVLARRPALDLPTRRENIEKAITVAKQSDQLALQVARLREALGLSSPWPIDETLQALIEVVAHLAAAHDCDCHGHEHFGVAAVEAQKQITKLREALSETPTEAVETVLGPIRDQLEDVLIARAKERMIEDYARKALTLINALMGKEGK